MKILYIVNARMPTEKAHGVQVMKTCEAFSKLGHEVTVLVPRRKNTITVPLFEYYSIPQIFSVTYLPTLDLIRFGALGFFIQSLTFSLSVFFYALKHSDFKIIYSREILPLWFLSFLSRNLYFEGHNAERSTALSRVMNKARGFVGITEGVKKFLISKGASEKNILVAPDGVDLSMFTISESSEECRKRLGLPLDKKLVVYSGHLYAWKGAHTLAEAAQLLTEDTATVFVGGTAGDIETFTKQFSHPHVMILGHKPYKDIPFYLRAADLLAIPNSGKEAISKLYTSPIKLFEYMASGRPIIASRLPSLCEILNDSNAYLVESDSPQALAKGITTALNNTAEAEQKSQQALQDVEQYSWNKRAERIIDFIEQCLKK